jgi:hypothetical protein
MGIMSIVIFNHTNTNIIGWRGCGWSGGTGGFQWGLERLPYGTFRYLSTRNISIILHVFVRLYIL